ncbi:MAG TPA: choice-of-anchor tandem repeat GloVer-containing protein [Pirellulales bacterium]|jgi:uncharacterized repeat protein (TIGR03803 family)
MRGGGLANLLSRYLIAKRKRALSHCVTSGGNAFRDLRCEHLESRRLLTVDGMQVLPSASAAMAGESTASDVDSAVNVRTVYSLGTTSGDATEPQRAPLVAFGAKLYGMTDAGGINNAGALFSVNDDGSDFQTLHLFGPANGPNGSNPGLTSGLTIIGSTLFGTTENGGSSSNDGTLFAIALDGSNYRVLHSFVGGASDGAIPDASPVLIGSVLYGTTSAGGASGDGTVYSINPDGSNFQIVHSFLGGPADGANPYTEIVQVGSLLYGTTAAGGANGWGAAFSMALDGSNYQVLHSFTTGGFYGPGSQLFPVGSTLYGIAVFGGTNSDGYIYSMSDDGSDYQVLHNFTGTAGDGVNPASNLTLIGSTFYGTTLYGGINSGGTIYSINADGSNYQVLHSLTTLDGQYLYGSLTVVGSTLYGLAAGGGTFGGGTLFSLGTDGSNFEVEYNLSGAMSGNSADGSTPRAALVADGSTLFGTTSNGINGNGATVFAVADDGTSFRVLHVFSSSQGSEPVGTLILVGQTLYGEAAGSFSGSNGLVFSVNTDGSNFQILHWFTGGSQGQFGASGLILVGSTLYGTAGGGGNMANVVFSLNLDGSGYKTLHQFPTSFSLVPSGSITAELTLVGSTIVGTTNSGGANGDGEIFSMNLDGSDFHVLHAFAGGAADGISAMGGVTLVGDTLVGSTTSGGTDNDGTIYSLGIDGSNYHVLHSFTGGPDDGSNPQGRLLLIGATLYGTAAGGGSSGKGIAYSFEVNGATFQVLYSFNSAANPNASLTLSGSTLYGTTASGGAVGHGTVFALTGAIPPGPQVTDLLVDGTSWTPDALNALAVAGLGNGEGYEIPVGSTAQLEDLPWDNLNQVRIVFNEDVNVAEASLIVSGLSGTPLVFSAFAYDHTSHTATWTFASPISADRIKLALASTGPNAVTDVSGNLLDGDWTTGASSYPSGDGYEGGDFNFAFNVLPGDANGDGTVNVQDLAAISSGWLTAGRAGDINADGVINGQDLALLSSNWLATLPVGESSSGASVAVADSTSRAAASSSTGQSTTVAETTNSTTFVNSLPATDSSVTVAAKLPGTITGNGHVTVIPWNFVGPLRPEYRAPLTGQADPSLNAVVIDRVLSQAVGDMNNRFGARASSRTMSLVESRFAVSLNDTERNAIDGKTVGERWSSSIDDDLLVTLATG